MKWLDKISKRKELWILKRGLIVLILLLLVSSTCFAGPVSDGEISLGGISVNSTAAYVKSVYGEPTKIRNEYDGEEDAWEHVWYYGNAVEICFHADDWNTVSHVIVTANNGFSTPVGVYVGMRESALGEIYGAPLKLQGEWYYYRSVSNLTTGVLIVVENGKIIRINIGDGFRLDG